MIAGLENTPWRREWLPTAVFLPGVSHGQRSLAGCSLWGHKESDTTEGLTLTNLHKLRASDYKILMDLKRNDQ